MILKQEQQAFHNDIHKFINVFTFSGVHFLVMPGEMVSTSKAFSTLSAGEKFGAIMKLLVSFETLWPTKAFSTIRALAWAHARMLLLMPPQIS